MSTQLERGQRQLCGVREAACICDREMTHDGPHHCSCGGSWHIDEAGTFHIVSYPQAAIPDVEIVS